MTETEMPSLPVIRECPFRAPPLYGQLRAGRPVSRARMPDGQLVWLVTSYDLSRKILADRRVSSNRADPAFPFAGSPEARKLLQDHIRGGRWSMLTSDAPVHGAHRRMLITEFSAPRIKELCPRIQEIVDRCVDDLLAAPQPADLVEHVALPVPSMVICELLGVPAGKRPDFQYWTKTMLNRDTPIEELIANRAAFTDFMDKLVTAKEDGTAGEDALGRLIERNRATGAMTHDEVVADAMLLLVAGHVTTANMISLGIAALLQNRASGRGWSRVPHCCRTR